MRYNVKNAQYKQYIDRLNGIVYFLDMEKLTIKEQIKILCGRSGVSVSELARMLGKSPQNFTQQLNRNDFRVSDLEKIADKLGVVFVYDFIEKK